MIQELIIAGAEILFMLSLIPTLVDRRSVVPLWTSVPVTVGLALLTAAFFTLGLWLATITAFGAALLWVLIALFRAPRTRKDRWDGI